MQFVYSEEGEKSPQSFIHGMLEWDELRRTSWPPGQYLVYREGDWFMCSYKYISETPWEMYREEYRATNKDWEPYHG